MKYKRDKSSGSSKNGKSSKAVSKEKNEHNKGYYSSKNIGSNRSNSKQRQTASLLLHSPGVSDSITAELLLKEMRPR